MGPCLTKTEPAHLVQVDQIQVLSAEEKVIRTHENQYFFSKKNFKEIVQAIKSVSYEGTLSAAQLRRAFADLEIPSEELTTPDSSTFHLLSKTKNDKKLFELKKLSLISILLGKGDIKSKSEWIFREYDIDASDVLELSEFNEMVNDIIQMSAEVIPVISIGEGVGSLSKEQCDTYTSKLMSAKDILIAQLAEDIGKFINISHEDFFNFMALNGKLNFLLSTGNVRETLRRSINN
jgi:hypothetical protein